MFICPIEWEDDDDDSRRFYSTKESHDIQCHKCREVKPEDSQ